jgi:hypothetical protein
MLRFLTSCLFSICCLFDIGSFRTDIGILKYELSFGEHDYQVVYENGRHQNQKLISGIIVGEGVSNKFCRENILTGEIHCDDKIALYYDTVVTDIAVLKEIMLLSLDDIRLAENGDYMPITDTSIEIFSDTSEINFYLKRSFQLSSQNVRSLINEEFFKNAGVLKFHLYFQNTFITYGILWSPLH